MLSKRALAEGTVSKPELFCVAALYALLLLMPLFGLLEAWRLTRRPALPPPPPTHHRNHHLLRRHLPRHHAPSSAAFLPPTSDLARCPGRWQCECRGVAAHGEVDGGEWPRLVC